MPGQRGQRLKAGHRANIRAKMREDRSKHANRIVDKLGVAITALTSEHILYHTEEGDSSGRGKRGMQSFDAESIATAKKHKQRALKKEEGGTYFTSIIDRFTHRLLEREWTVSELCSSVVCATQSCRPLLAAGLGPFHIRS